MSDEMETRQIAEQAPVRRSVPWLALGLVLLLVGSLAAVAIPVANKRWGRRAMVATGIVAAQAIIEGRAPTLLAVSNEIVRSQLTTATAEEMRQRGVLGEFDAPTWTGLEATMTVSTGMGVGEIGFAPAADGADVVVFRTQGVLGKASGALSMERTWSGWVVSGFMVAPTQKPTGHPSTATTSTP